MGKWICVSNELGRKNGKIQYLSARFLWTAGLVEILENVTIR